MVIRISLDNVIWKGFIFKNDITNYKLNSKTNELYEPGFILNAG